MDPVARHHEPGPDLLGPDPRDDSVVVLARDLDRQPALDHGVEMVLEQRLQLALAQDTAAGNALSTPSKPRRATCRPPEKSGTPVIVTDAATIASATPV